MNPQENPPRVPETSSETPEAALQETVLPQEINVEQPEEKAEKVSALRGSINKMLIGLSLLAAGTAAPTDVSAQKHKEKKMEMAYVMDQNIHAKEITLGDDPTQQYYLVNIDDYNSYADVLTAIKQQGFEMLTDAEAQERLKELRTTNIGAVDSVGHYVMALSNESAGAKEGENAMGSATKRLRTVFTDEKKGVFSDGQYDFAQNSDFTSTDAYYSFLVKKQKTNADYATGIANNK